MDPLVVVIALTGWIAVSSVVLACAIAAGRADHRLERARADAARRPAPRAVDGALDVARLRERVTRLERRAGLADRRRSGVADRRRASRASSV